MTVDIEEILPSILPSKSTNDIEQNIKLIKRKLNIYNLKSDTNYSLEDFGLKIIYNKWKNKTSLFYLYKELNEDFDYNLLYVYKENYYKTFKFLKNILNDCEIYKNEEYPNSLFLFKDGRFVLEQNLKSKEFWLSESLIWSKLESNCAYKWLEISNLCNSILEETFKQGAFTTFCRRFYGVDFWNNVSNMVIFDSIKNENLNKDMKDKINKTDNKKDNKKEFNLTEKGEETLNLYLNKLKSYYQDLDNYKRRNFDLKAKELEAVINSDELDEYKEN